MSDIIRLKDHVRASSATLKPKTDGLASFPKAARAPRKSRKFSCDIFPLERQLLTADAPTPAKEAATASPPTASITSSTEFSMSAYSSRNVNLSSVHGMGLESPRSVTFNGGMAESAKSLASRLKATRVALELPPSEICKRIKVTPSAWSMYESGERRITLVVANKLCDEFGLSLDWIYRANPSQLPHALRMKMRQAA